MNEVDIKLDHVYLFLDWYRKRLGELEPIVKALVIAITPQHRANDGILRATRYTLVDSSGTIHYGSSNCFRPLNWIDDRKNIE